MKFFRQRTDMPAKPKPLGLKMVRGVVFSVVRKVVAGPLFLLLVPFTLHRLGTTGYGTWAILATVINISWFLDLGLGSTVIKYVAEYGGNKDLDRVRGVLDTAFFLYLVIATLTVGFLALASNVILRALFRGELAPMADALSLWPLLLVTVAADILARPFGSVINGLQRIDLSNVLLFLRSLCNSLLTIILLFAGAKLHGLMWAALLSSLFSLGANFVVSCRLLPGIVPNPFRFDMATLRRICSFGLALSAGHTMTMLQGQLEKLYLARFVGVVSVGWYEVASEAASKVRRMPDLLLSPVMAAASELHAGDERHKMQELYFRTSKYFAVTAIPLVVFSIFAAKDLVRLWLGSGLTMIAVPFAGLVVGNFFLQLGAPTYNLLVGKGILRPGVYSAFLASILNLVLSFVFIKRWGFAGAMLGTVLPMIISTIYFLIASAPHMEIPFSDVLRRAYWKPVLCSVAAAFSMWPTGLLGLQGTRNLAARSVLFGTTYVAGLVLTRFFDKFDFAKAEHYMPFVRTLKRVIPLQLRELGVGSAVAAAASAPNITVNDLRR